MSWKHWAASVGLLVALGAIAAPEAAPDAAQYAQITQYEDVRISPDGSYVAVASRAEGLGGLLVIRLEDKQLIGRFVLGPGALISDFYWVGPFRLVASTAKTFGTLEGAREIGELVAFDADGKNRTYLGGYRAPIGPVTILSKRIDLSDSFDYTSFVAPDRAKPNEALISVYRLGGSAELGRAKLFHVDTRSGARTLIATAPVPGAARFLIDADGVLRYVLVRREKEADVSYAFDASGDWRPLPTTSDQDARLTALSIEANTIYLFSDERDGRSCLLAQSLVDGSRKTISCDDEADLDGVIPSLDRRALIATFSASGRPGYRYLDTEHPHRILLEKLQNSFPDAFVAPVSATRDGRRAVILVASDREPGRYFLLDTETEKARFLLARQPWAEPKQMPERRPVTYAARDGQLIHAFLTIPPGQDLKALPMVVMPHGGPFNISDDWFWDGEAAWLAQNGYLVLQPEFRGSGGYGRGFVNAGKQRWATTMIDDITDGTRWAIDQGYADPARIGIDGGSYGGYAALMSAIREPALYRCVIDDAGVVDLRRWRDDVDGAEFKSTRDYIRDYVGADSAALKAASPIEQIDKLQAPVLIVHGEDDLRVPYSQAKQLRKALDARHLPYEWLIKAHEGHGFYKPENRIEQFETELRFLNRYLAPANTTAKPPEAVAAPGG